MERAIDFYEQFLGRQVTINDNIFSIFEIEGFRYCLFNNQAVNETVKWGDNCLPSFEVDDINAAYEKVVGLNCPIAYQLKQIGDNMIFEFTDCEGNDIEVYAKA
jgi:predicted enzyme related to lactoylglutathione lyase